MSDYAEVIARLARLEANVEAVREDVGEMKDEWERIRVRLHNLENDTAAAKAAKAALEAVKSQAWTRWVAVFGALGGVTAFIGLLVSLAR